MSFPNITALVIRLAPVGHTRAASGRRCRHAVRHPQNRRTRTSPHRVVRGVEGKDPPLMTFYVRATEDDDAAGVARRTLVSPLFPRPVLGVLALACVALVLLAVSFRRRGALGPQRQAGEEEGPRPQAQRPSFSAWSGALSDRHNRVKVESTLPWYNFRQFRRHTRNQIGQRLLHLTKWTAH